MRIHSKYYWLLRPADTLRPSGHENTDEFLEEFPDAFGKITLPICFAAQVSAKCAILKQSELPTKIRTRLIGKSYGRQRNTFVLCFTSIHDFDVSSYKTHICKLNNCTEDHIGGDTTWKKCAQDQIIDSLSGHLGNMMVVANIARPGCVEVLRKLPVVDRKIGGIDDDGMYHLLEFAIKSAEKLGWPQIKTLPFLKVWEWATKIPGFMEQTAEGDLGHALGALTQLFKPNIFTDNTLNLVWALVGLEALYCKGNQNLKGQLLEKSETLLGPRSANKKRFGAMYDFRSAFIHGDIDFPYRHALYDELVPFARPLEDSLQIAVAMLLATLQSMVAL